MFLPKLFCFQKAGGSIDLEPCLTHTSTVEPTLAPVVVERTMTTRAAASVLRDFLCFAMLFIYTGTFRPFGSYVLGHLPILTYKLILETLNMLCSENVLIYTFSWNFFLLNLCLVVLAVIHSKR
jgi:hypothetical protein